MNPKIVEFENRLGDLITETFETIEDLEDAIKYYGDSTITSFLKEQIQYYETD